MSTHMQEKQVSLGTEGLRCELEFQSVDDAIKFVQTAVKKKDTLWIHTGDELYPCLAVCTNDLWNISQRT